MHKLTKCPNILQYVTNNFYHEAYIWSPKPNEYPKKLCKNYVTLNWHYFQILFVETFTIIIDSDNGSVQKYVKSLYLNQWWLQSSTPYGIIKPHSVNENANN